MRSICYRMVMDDTDAYLIYNAETTWNTMPYPDNLKRPSIRVINEPEHGTISADIADHVTLSDACDPDPYFTENYIRILRGEVPEWVLAVIQISWAGVVLAFFKRETGQEQDLYVEWSDYLVTRFEVEREDGGMDAYVLRMSAAEGEHGLNYLSVDEYDEGGRRCRELRFTPATTTEPKLDDIDWSYVCVTEYR